MEVPTQDGIVWVKDNVLSTTSLFGGQYSIFKVDAGGAQ